MMKWSFLCGIACLLIAGCADKNAEAMKDFFLNPATPVSGPAALQGKYDVKKSPYFKQLDFYNMKSSGTLILLPQFKTVQQTTELTAGPACVLMALNYFGKADGVTERQLAVETDTRDYEHARCDGGFGTTREAIAQAFEKRGIRTRIDAVIESEEELPAFIKSELQKGNLILINYASWVNHWSVVIGYDDMGTAGIEDDVVILADPADTSDHCQDGYTIYSAERLFFANYDPGVLYGEYRDGLFVIAEKPVR